MKYRFLNEHRHEFRIAMMCWVPQVTRGRFYQWGHKPLSDRDIEDQRLLGVICDSSIASEGGYVARRIFGDLRETSEICGKHRVEKIMHAHHIKAIRGYKTPRHIVGRPSIAAPNRLPREFTVDIPDQAWMTDIACLQTWQGWRLYLAVVINLHSRKRWAGP